MELVGIEPTTSPLRTARSPKLSYSPTLRIVASVSATREIRKALEPLAVGRFEFSLRPDSALPYWGYTKQISARSPCAETNAQLQAREQ